MKYGLRITKDIATGTLTVHRITPVRDTARGYRIDYPEAGTAENLQVFDTKKEAEEAAEYEKYAAEYAGKSKEELMEIFHKDFEMYREIGLSQTAACKIMQLPYYAIRAYAEGMYAPNPRVIARLHLSLMVLYQAREKMARILPDLGVCGRQSCDRRRKPASEK